jgi:tetratricopeptide (TPR) repeat protein
VDKGSLRISLINLSAEGGDGYRYPLSKRFFYLYVYLAYQRSINNRDDGGFVDLEKIRHLPFWEKNSIESVGKQIRRHVMEMEKAGKNVIEAQQKIKGPFRLTLQTRKISFDVEAQAIKEYLGLDQLAIFYAEENEENFFKYINAITHGDIHFNEGLLARATRNFQQAMEQSTTSQQKIVAMQRLGRTYERLGNYDEALKTHRAAIKVLKKGTHADYYDLALTYNNLAWLYYRKGNLKSAEKTYYLALNLIRGKMHNDLLGKINNGLGILYDLRGKYEEALGYFKNALALSCYESDFYGVSAAYFNIGNINKKKADEIVDRQKVITKEVPRPAKEFYMQAIEWAEKCIKLTERSGVGDETSQDRILVSYCCYVLRNYSKALKYAEEAEKMATHAGNVRDMALSCKILGDILWETDEKDKFKSLEFFKRSLELYQKLGDKNNVAKLQHKIEIISNHTRIK